MADLKSGYTTGTCAAIAAKAACRMIFERTDVERENIITPKGVIIETAVLEQKYDEKSGECAVRKYSGDDPDVTNGILVFSKVILKKEKSIDVDGGIGVGRVTKKGLQQEVGKAAINKVPEGMIKAAVSEIFEKYGYENGADIIVSIPEGVEIAKKTFNPRLGIEGGISVLGTSGIVEPMSEQAIIDTINVELSVKRMNEGEYVMIAPGNYGIDFIREAFNVNLDRAVKCSNFLGQTLDFAVKDKFKGVLLIGHIGKFIKLAGGIMNTHSRNADSRMEIMASNTACVCDDINIVRRIMECITTDQVLDILQESGLRERVMKRIIDRAAFYVNNRVKGEIETAVLMFSNVYGILGQTDNANDMFKRLK